MTQGQTCCQTHVAIEADDQTKKHQSPLALPTRHLPALSEA